mgnify:FL=1
MLFRSAGEVVEINEALSDHPEQVNASPFADGWIFRLRSTESAALNALMTQAQYDEYIRTH